MENLGFELPEGTDARQLFAELAEHYWIKEEQPLVKDFTIYDTFDWRLLAKSLALYHCGNALELRRLPDGLTLQRIATASQPIFAWDLPESEFKEKLTPIIEMRALMRLAEVQTHSTTLRVLNQDEKTVARLVYEETQPSPVEEESTSVAQIWLQPVRGYPRYSRELSETLQGAGLPACDQLRIHKRVLRAVGKEPGDYSAKLDFRLDPQMRADEATKIILRFLLQVMKSNETGIKDDIDTEFLHDFRVAMRRTRSALTQVRGVFPAEVVGRFKTDFASLGQLTNPLRDLDVYLLKESTYKAMLSGTSRDEIDPMFEHLRAKRSQALQEVIRGLDSEGYPRVLHDWEAFLNEPPEDPSGAPNADRPIIDVARERINKRYRSILKAGDKLLEHSDDAGLHALRIECKKLRYLLEFFASLFPSKKIAHLVAQLKRLQDNLGDFNDLCVQVDYLVNIAEELPMKDAKTKKTLLAIGCLVGSLDVEKLKVKEAFAQTFTGFASPANRKLFRELFATTKRASR